MLGKESVATLKQRLEDLERENGSLRARLAQVGVEAADHRMSDDSQARLHENSGRGRSVLSVCAIAVAVILFPAAVIGSWAHAQLTNTDAFVTEFAPLAKNSEVQKLVTDETVAVIDREIDLPALTAALVDGIEGLGASPSTVSAARALEVPLNMGLSNLVRSTVADMVSSEAFADIWRTALRLSHSEAIKTINGDTDAATVIGEDGTLGVQLGPVVERVKQALLDRGLDAAARIPTTDRSVPIATDLSVEGVRQGYGAAVTVTAWLPWISIGLLAAGVLIARRRRRALIGASVGLAAGMLVLLLAFMLLERLFSALTPLPRGAADAVFRAVTGPSFQTAAAVLTVAIVLVGVAWFAGPAQFPARLRGFVASGAKTLRDIAVRHELGNGPFGVWCERWQRDLRAVVAVAAGAAVLLIRPLTPGLVFGSLLGAVVALLLIEFVRRPAIALADTESASAEDAVTVIAPMKGVRA